MATHSQEPAFSDKQATDFDAIRLGIASPERVLEWSHGKVTKPETINYRTQKPEKDGLFCERIFGPTKDWECYCGKYKGTHYRGVVCDRCGVLVTRSIIRRERMGHIELAVPVTHIWFLRGTASVIGLLLNITSKSLEKIVYFASYVITSVDEDAKKAELKSLEADYKQQKEDIKKKYDKEAGKKDADIKKIAEDQGNALAECEAQYTATKVTLNGIEVSQLLTESEYRELSGKYKKIFTAGIGAEAIDELLGQIDLNKTVRELRRVIAKAQGQRLRKCLKRLKLIEGLRQAGIQPKWMIMKNLPVIPPDLRPMVQLPGGRFATSDLNDLYRRVINRNNRLQKLIDIKAPEVIRRNEMRMLQEAVDALIDNSHARGGRAVSGGGGRRKLKSLSDMLRGKQGRFRQNLLGKRVDYSGRSVIVAGPELAMDECGLPKMMALELFKPFIIGRLIEKDLAHNVKIAGRMIENGETEVWDALDEVIEGKYVLLNRAPTLHRLGVQAFMPRLIDGKAIQLHPLVCAGFNADFDGDQMAVHLPLSAAAQAEARQLMSAKHNLLKPSDGNSIIYIAQDMVLGIYYITYDRYPGMAPKYTFSSDEEASRAFENGLIDYQTPIQSLLDGNVIITTYGRILFNQVLPEGYEYLNQAFDGDALQALLTTIFDNYTEDETAAIADRIKDLGFRVATDSGLSTGMEDYNIPPQKASLMRDGDKRAAEVARMYADGLIADNERARLTIDVWQDINKQLKKVLEEQFNQEDNSTTVTVVSGARASLNTIAQISAMKGLVQDVYGETIELPIKSNYKEGLKPLEYFAAARGGRKGLVDTALKTADAGYLTRRLVDVSQDIFTTEDDCGDTDGIAIYRQRAEESGQDYSFYLVGRVAAKAVSSKGKTIVRKGELINKAKAAAIMADESIDGVSIRSVLRCQTLRGICRNCYGVDLGRGDMVGLRVPVGVIAAQAVGEPGTQLTLRTFHRGGTAEEDITHGFSRIEELFEARNPKGEAVLADIDGVVTVRNEGEKYRIYLHSPKANVKKYPVTAGMTLKVKDDQKVQPGDVLAITKDGKREITSKQEGLVKLEKGQIKVTEMGGDAFEYVVPTYRTLMVEDSDIVTAGQRITSGSMNLQDLLRLTDETNVEQYIMNEIQMIYSLQGQTISDKHLEVIVRQMLSRVQIEDSGDSSFVTGDIVSKATAIEENTKLKKDKKQLTDYKQLLLGVIRVASSSDSFLSAASFQDTTRVLIAAATQGKLDHLYGLKENVIIGRQIPVGTGFHGVEGKESVES